MTRPGPRPPICPRSYSRSLIPSSFGPNIAAVPKEQDPIIDILTSLVDEVEAVTTHDRDLDELVIQDRGAERRLHTRCFRD